MEVVDKVLSQWNTKQQRFWKADNREGKDSLASFLSFLSIFFIFFFFLHYFLSLFSLQFLSFSLSYIFFFLLSLFSFLPRLLALFFKEKKVRNGSLFSCQGVSGRIFNEHFPMSQVNLSKQSRTCLQCSKYIVLCGKRMYYNKKLKAMELGCSTNNTV